MIEPLLQRVPTIADNLTRGLIVAVRSDGLVEVQTTIGEKHELLCRVLVQDGSGTSWLSPGAEVLISTLPSAVDDGIVLGLIDYCQQSTSVEKSAVETQTIQAKKIVIEAGEELELCCGKGTIKIQQDGKIIIRGENILNKAKGTHRIKGGSVGIN